MAKSNPLFIDSTRMTGDSIGTQVELSKIALYEGETLTALITSHLGEVTPFLMKINAEFDYQTRVWLRHQKNFTYQFVIERDGNRILQSAVKQGRGQPAILEKWEPILAEPGAVVTPALEPAAPAPPSKIPAHAQSVADMIQKFGF